MWFGITLILLALPLLELAVLIKVGQSIGVFGTIGLLILSAGIGFLIVNAQGMAAFRRATESLNQGRTPVEPVIDGAMLMIAGWLFVIPGLLSDAVAVLFLIPPLRRRIAHWLLGRMTAAGTIEVTTWSSDQGPRDPGRPANRDGRSARPASTTVIEGEFERIDEKTARPRGEDTPPR